MTHDELRDYIDKFDAAGMVNEPAVKALRAVVELHKPSEAWGDTHCGFCFDLAWEPSGLHMDSKQFTYPCPTIQAIEKELK